MKPMEPMEPTTTRPRSTAAFVIAMALAAELGYAVLNISTMPVYLRYERGFGEAAIGLFLVAFLVSEAIFKSFMGRLSDRFGFKPFLIIAPLLSLGACLVTLLIPVTHGSAPEYAALIGLRLIDGIAAGSFWPAAYSCALSLAPPNQSQRALSNLNACYLVGIALALPLGGVIDDATHSHLSGLLLAAVFFASAAAFALLSTMAKGASAPATAEDAPAFKLPAQVRWHVLLTFVTFLGVGFPMAIIKLFAHDAFGLSESQFGALVVPGALAMALLSAPAGRVGEKLGPLKAVQLGLGLCALGIVGIGLGAILPAARQLWVLAIGAVPAGLGFILALPAWMTVVSNVNPAAKGTLIGAVMAAQGFGAIVGAPLGGLLYQSLQNSGSKDLAYFSPFLACALCVSLGWVMSLLTKETSGAR